METRVLGPVEVRIGDQVGAPTGAKQRLLLAALVRDAGRIVPADRLVELLWGDGLPADPRASLRTQVTRLRGFLQDLGTDPDVLVWSGHGYRLALDPAQVDAEVFTTRLREARQLDDPDERTREIDEILGLWRGDPYAEMEHRYFDGQVARLREARQQALEARLEALLEAGRTGEALAAAELLVADDPLRERPRALLMEALYRAGRQHEALATFQEYRRLLSEELGLDPSPALRTLESEILQHRARSDPAPSLAPESRIAAAPHPVTPLIGREAELASARRLLSSVRLLTLTGAGGTGKTRLANELALDPIPGREACWVPLEKISDPDLVVSQVAAALGVGERPGQSLLETVVEASKGRMLLVVLDNCEHVLEAAASLVSALLEATPDVEILATSRFPLGVSGETAWPVPPLGLPAEGTESVDRIAEAPAVRFLLERARASTPDFQVTRENAGAVAKICRRLDGLPLALELAAARLRLLGAGQLAARLDDLFDVLPEGPRSAPSRQRTLEATIDWTVQLLSEPERELLQELSTFAGGFSLDAVEEICTAGDDPGGKRRVKLDVLASLLDKSLVTLEAPGEPPRYRMLETLRQYAAQRLRDTPSWIRTRDRHAAHFLALAEEAEPSLFGGAGDARWMSRLDLEEGNLREAVEWGLADPSRVATALRILTALHWYWFARGRFAGCRTLLERGLAAGGHVPPEVCARALSALAIIGVWQGDGAFMRPRAEASVALLRESADTESLVYALTVLGATTVGADPGRARTACLEAVELLDGAAPTPLAAFSLFWLGLASLAAGDDEGAREPLERAVEIGRALDHQPTIAHPQTLLSRTLAGLGHDAVALEGLEESLRIHDRLGDRFGLVLVVEGIAGLAARKGQVDGPARLFAAAQSLRESIGGPLLPFEERRYEGVVASLLDRMGVEPHERARGQGGVMDLAEMVSLATDTVQELWRMEAG